MSDEPSYEQQRLGIKLGDVLLNNTLKQIEELKRQVEHYKNACIKISHDTEQILGKALGYPWYKNDQKNFPDSTEADGVCVAEHVPETLAIEIVKRLAVAEEILAWYADEGNWYEEEQFDPFEGHSLGFLVRWQGYDSGYTKAKEYQNKYMKGLE